MAVIATALINVWLLIRNAWAGLLRKPPDYVTFEVGGTLPEFETPVGFLRRRLGAGPPALSLERIRERLDQILADGRCRGVVLRISGLDAGWAALEEMRGEIHRFRERGGRVVAYLIEADTRAFYLASSADEIHASPLTTLNLTGLRVRVDFLKDALKRVGVEAEVIAVSPYKSAGDIFTRNDFSEEAREQTERLLDDRFEELVNAVSTGRNLSREEVRRKIDNGPYVASHAVDEGLLDGVCYEDELPGKLGADGKRAKLAEWNTARRTLKRQYRKRVRRGIGVVSLSGIIVRGRSRRLPIPLPLVGGEQAGSESVVAALRLAERSRRVAGILFHVDSRGGDALASDLIWREVERIRAKKPVVVLMGNVAASGGYYVSAAANRVTARRNTTTGSIGVVITRPVAVGLYGKLGINPVAVERGARAGLLDPSQTPGADELEVLEGQLRDVYDEFKNRVTRGRGLDPNDLENIAGGRVWSGTEARERGLVDELAGFREAVRATGEFAGIEADDLRVLLKISPPRSGRPMPGDPVETVEGLKRAFMGLWTGGVWAISPYEASRG